FWLVYSISPTNHTLPSLIPFTPNVLTFIYNTHLNAQTGEVVVTQLQTSLTGNKQWVSNMIYKREEECDQLSDCRTPVFVRQIPDHLRHRLEGIVDYYVDSQTSGHMLWFNINGRPMYCFTPYGQSLSLQCNSSANMTSFEKHCFTESTVGVIPPDDSLTVLWILFAVLFIIFVLLFGSDVVMLYKWWRQESADPPTILIGHNCQLQTVSIMQYPSITTNDCGISRLSPGMEQSCFTFHKQFANLYGGREAMPGDVPWSVFIRKKEKQKGKWNKCTPGTSCTEFVLEIHPGVSLNVSDRGAIYYADKIIKHSNYTNKPDEYDVALVKLNTSIVFKPDRLLNSICLPTRHHLNGKHELALVAGYGYVGELGYQAPLRVGYIRIQPTNMSWVSMIEAYQYPDDSGTRICPGDSGSGLWQVANGRAVLIGVAVFGVTERLTKCLPPPGSTNGYARVSTHIDWIQKTISTN
ncbi:unnamed protein product, partial [Medioppia subpectinata]